MSADAGAPGRDSLIQYPSAFPIKVMGAHVDGFTEAIVAVARQFDPGFDAATVEKRPARAATTSA
jgi:putative lipoic acid-binding regulatory protein